MMKLQRVCPAVLTRFSTLLIAGMLVITCFIATSVGADEVQFGGVGLQVVPTINGDLVVLNVLEDAPAAKMGLLPGDLIFQVNDFPLQGSDFGKVVSEHLWGPVGSTVELFYRRPGIAGVSRAVVQRSAIDPRLTVTPTVQNGSSGSN
ncbi:MAG: PDZ domain-containing protein [Desulfuromonadales bacterium]|nr:PDZ domain-containing protein [Desulfuromonadales bacterium]